MERAGDPEREGSVGKVFATTLGLALAAFNELEPFQKRLDAVDELWA